MLSYHGVSIMPLAYIGVALSAIIVHVLTNKFSGKISLIQLIYYNHTVQIVILILLSALIGFGLVGPLVSLGFYIYISIFALITVTYFYQYCQSLLTIRDAKRIYAFIGSAAISGGVFGGYLTSILVPFVGNLGMVICSAILLIISGVIIHFIHKGYSEDEANTLYTVESPSSAIDQLSILNNSHVKNIAMIIGLGVVVSKLVDYQFNFLAYENIKGEDALTAFFGFCFSSINVVGLCLQMFLVSKIMKRFGVSKSLAVMPLFLLLGSVLLLIFPILFFGVVIKLIEGSLKQSVYKTSTEINIMPLTTSLRNRAKTFVDVVVDSIATGLVGIIIYILINKAALPFYFIGGITSFIICLWIYAIYRSSRTYKIELAKMVKGDYQSLDESERVGTNIKKIALDQYLIENKTKGETTKETLLKLTRHQDVNIRKSAILRYVDNFGIRSISDLSHCTRDPELLVRKAVFFAFIMKARTEQQIEDLYIGLSTKNFIIVTAALAEAIGNNSKQKRLFLLNDRIEEAYNKLVFEESSLEVEKLFGQIYRAITICKYIKRYPLIIDAIHNPSSVRLQKEALRAVAYGKAKRIFDVLEIDDIADENKKNYYKTLSVFPNKLLIKAESMLMDKNKRIHVLLPAFEYVDSQRHVNFLFRLLDHPSLKTRRVALRMINNLRKKYNHLSFDHRSNMRRLNYEIKYLKRLSAAIIFVQDVQLKNDSELVYEKCNDIIRTLSRQVNRTILSTFIYLSLITEKDELSMIYQAIKSTRKDAALDLLDGILEYKIRKNLIPVLDVVSHKRYTASDLKLIKQKPMNAKRIMTFVRSIKDDRLLALVSDILLENKIS